MLEMQQIYMKIKHKKNKTAKQLETDLNILIDHTFHPYFSKDKGFVIIDGVLHFIVEQNPKMSIKKFVRYSLKHLL